MEFFRDLPWYIWLILVLVTVFVVFAIKASVDQEIREAVEWKTFVKANDCHVVETKDEQTVSGYGPVFGFDGKVGFAMTTNTIPAQECWLCNNGKKYWKKMGLGN